MGDGGRGAARACRRRGGNALLALVRRSRASRVRLCRCVRTNETVASPVDVPALFSPLAVSPCSFAFPAHNRARIARFSTRCLERFPAAALAPLRRPSFGASSRPCTLPLIRRLEVARDCALGAQARPTGERRASGLVHPRSPRLSPRQLAATALAPLSPRASFFVSDPRRSFRARAFLRCPRRVFPALLPSALSLFFLSSFFPPPSGAAAVSVPIGRAVQRPRAAEEAKRNAAQCSGVARNRSGEGERVARRAGCARRNESGRAGDVRSKSDETKAVAGWGGGEGGGREEWSKRSGSVRSRIRAGVAEIQGGERGKSQREGGGQRGESDAPPTAKRASRAARGLSGSASRGGSRLGAARGGR